MYIYINTERERERERESEDLLGGSDLDRQKTKTGCGKAPRDAEVSGTLRRSERLQESNADES